MLGWICVGVGVLEELQACFGTVSVSGRGVCINESLCRDMLEFAHPLAACVGVSGSENLVDGVGEGAGIVPAY
jgi:hypothetical protein